MLDAYDYETALIFDERLDELERRIERMRQANLRPDLDEEGSPDYELDPLTLEDLPEFDNLETDDA